MKHNNIIWFFCFALALSWTGCSDDAMTELERTEARFEEELGCQIGMAQWWETSVKLEIEVEADTLTRLWLLSSQQNALLYDYKEIQRSGTVTMTAPQGQGNTVYLSYSCNKGLQTKAITLSGKPIESVKVSTQREAQNVPCTALNQTLDRDHPYSLTGQSIAGNARYYQLDDEQMPLFFDMMSLVNSGNNYIELNNLTDNYELSSNGPFHVTWISGWEELQTPHMLGYFYHSPGTYEDIVYVDISETHRWDYIDGLSKLQYQISIEDEAGGFQFSPGVWYDANFDSRDYYGSTFSMNMDRIGDNAFNMQSVYHRYKQNLSAVRGISFTIDVPVGKHIGMYLRSVSEPYPSQWNRLRSKRIPPYVNSADLFRGTNFSASEMNIDGKRRSVIWDAGSIIWMGMEDIIDGGDYDCNDVVFCVEADLEIWEPEIIIPDINVSADFDGRFPWTLAFEDVNRNADFDFNDAVIQLIPDYEEEVCCVYAMAVGSKERMYLYYDGPEGEVCLGEMHEMFGNTNSLRYINTLQSVITTPTVSLECVPWLRDYTMEQDARRFSIRVQRGTCEDCMDTLALPRTPGELPEALLVAGEWNWPVEDTAIISSYPYFPNWAQDPSRTSYWDWYKNPTPETSVSY